MGLPAKRSCA